MLQINLHTYDVTHSSVKSKFDIPINNNIIEKHAHGKCLEQSKSRANHFSYVTISQNRYA